MYLTPYLTHVVGLLCWLAFSPPHSHLIAAPPVCSSYVRTCACVCFLSYLQSRISGCCYMLVVKISYMVSYLMYYSRMCVWDQIVRPRFPSSAKQRPSQTDSRPGSQFFSGLSWLPCCARTLNWASPQIPAAFPPPLMPCLLMCANLCPDVSAGAATEARSTRTPPVAVLYHSR